MQATRQRDTPPERALRSELHRRGMRYNVQRAPLPQLRRRADIVFPRARVAVYVDGCFWHACPVHGTWPKANAAWWRAKIESNRLRDRDTDWRLKEAGWTVVRVWEHEEPEAAADRVQAAVAAEPGPCRSS
jgi:DNA mismatch endonuclease, patch repair protein